MWGIFIAAGDQRSLEAGRTSSSSCTCARRRAGAPLLAHWVAAGRGRSRQFEAHPTLVQNHRAAQQPVARMNSGYGTTCGI